MGFIFECIYLGIVFTSEDVFCCDQTIMYIKKKKKKFEKKRNLDNLPDLYDNDMEQ